MHKGLDLSKKAWTSFVLLALIVLYLFGVPQVYSDSMYYYHVSRSLIDNGSFTTEYEPEYYDYRGHGIAYFNGKYVDVGAVGTSIINLPGLLVSKTLRGSNESIYTDYYMASYGHTFLDGLAVLLTAYSFGILSFLITWKLFYISIKNKIRSFLLSLGVFISSYVIFYFTIQPGYTHVYEYFCSLLIIYALTKLQKEPVKEERYITIASLASGLGFLVRPIFLIISFITFINILISSKRKWKALLIFILSHIPFLIIYFMYNYESYGSILSSGYNAIRAENFNISLDNFNFFNVLFSSYRGWFVYSPLFFLGLLGLIKGIFVKNIKLKAYYISLIASILLIALAYGFWPSWWGGGSYGARFLIVLAPVTIPGLINILKVRGKIIPALMIIFVIYSLTLNILSLFTPAHRLRPKEDKEGIMGAWNRYTPVDIFKYHYDLMKNNLSDPVNYVSEFIKNFNAPNTLLILTTGLSDCVLRLDERDKQEIKFIILEPYISRQDIDDSIKMYIRDSEYNKVYEAVINDPEVNSTYSFKYDKGEIFPVSKEISIVLKEDHPSGLDLDIYRALKLVDHPLIIYFEQGYNLKYTGPPLLLTYEGMEYFDLNFNY